MNAILANAQNIEFEQVLPPPFDGVQSSSIAFADVDSDADQDMLITGRNSSSSSADALGIPSPCDIP